MMTRLIPKIFYNDMNDALDLFVECMSFKILHRDDTLAVVERDGAKTYLVESPEFAAKDSRKSIETDAIGELFNEIGSKRPEMLHPNSRTVEKNPGAGSLPCGQDGGASFSPVVTRIPC